MALGATLPMTPPAQEASSLRRDRRGPHRGRAGGPGHGRPKPGGRLLYGGVIQDEDVDSTPDLRRRASGRPMRRELAALAVAVVIAVGACSALNRPRYECDPAALPPSGCAAGEGCYLDGEPQTSACAAEGSYFDDDGCNTNNDCVSGFDCVLSSNGAVCRRVCALGQATDCSPGTTISPYACLPPAKTSATDLYGFCCPTTGC
jgi:hypothetical protein